MAKFKSLFWNKERKPQRHRNTEKNPERKKIEGI